MNCGGHFKELLLGTLYLFFDTRLFCNKSLVHLIITKVICNKKKCAKKIIQNSTYKKTEKEGKMCRTKFLATRFISDGSSSQNLGLFWNDLSICSFSRFFRQTDVLTISSQILFIFCQFKVI